MKHIIKKLVSATIVGTAVFSIACSDWTEPEIKVIQDLTKPNIEKDETYWENLRAYKKSDHAIAFGWFGFWNGGTTKTSGALRNCPDSMDIIAIWGNERTKFNLTQAQIEDMRYVQQVKGTKVVFTIFSHFVEFGFPETDQGIEDYANALCDSVYKYGYDGLDLDHEPYVGGENAYFRDRVQMTKFVKALGKRLGPKSGSGKLLLVDGELWEITAEAAPYFDYAVAQAYGSGASSLQSRYDRIENNWEPEQFVVTENFEAYWKTGGRLLEQAVWNPRQGRKGGVGTYHMEYECAHDPDYKFLRQAIQIQNPAVLP